MQDLEGSVHQALDSGPSTELDPADARILEVRSLGASGAEAAAIRFADGSRAFAKRYLGPEASERLRGETDGLLALAAVLPTDEEGTAFRLTVPRVLRADSASGLLLCEWVETHPSPRNETGLARALASMQRRSTRTAPQRSGFDATTFLGDTRQHNDPVRVRREDDWPTFFVQRRLGAMLLQLRPVAPRALTQALERLCAHAPDFLREAAETNVLLHGDLWSGNLLWTSGGAALVDPAAYWGHREAELGMLTLYGGLGPDFYDGYRRVWPLAPGWQRRVAIYRLYHVLNHRVLFGSSYDGSAMRLLDELTA